MKTKSTTKFDPQILKNITLNGAVIFSIILFLSACSGNDDPDPGATPSIKEPCSLTALVRGSNFFYYTYNTDDLVSEQLFKYNNSDLTETQRTTYKYSSGKIEISQTDYGPLASLPEPTLQSIVMLNSAGFIAEKSDVDGYESIKYFYKEGKLHYYVITWDENPYPIKDSLVVTYDGKGDNITREDEFRWDKNTSKFAPHDIFTYEFDSKVNPFFQKAFYYDGIEFFNKNNITKRNSESYLIQYNSKGYPTEISVVGKGSVYSTLQYECD